MKICIEGDAKEIAALVLATQGQQPIKAEMVLDGKVFTPAQGSPR